METAISPENKEETIVVQNEMGINYCQFEGKLIFLLHTLQSY